MLKKVCLISMLFILSSVCFAAYTLPETITCNFKTHMCNLPHNSYNLHVTKFSGGHGIKKLIFSEMYATAKSVSSTNNSDQRELFHNTAAVYSMLNSDAYVIITAGPNVFADSSYFNSSYHWTRMPNFYMIMLCTNNVLSTDCPVIQKAN